MAELTTIMELSFPSKDAPAWFPEFDAAMQRLAALAFAGREDRNFFIFSAGTFTFDSGAALLSWDAELIGVLPTTGALWGLLSGSVNILDGGFAYLEIARGSSAPQTILVAASGAKVPSGDNYIVFAWRVGTSIYFRNGAVLGPGESAPVFNLSSVTGRYNGQTPYSCSAGLAVGTPVYISGSAAVAASDATDATAMPVIGFVSYKPTTTTCYIQQSGEVASSGLTPGAVLYASETAGEVTETAPVGAGKVVQMLGVAKTASLITLLLGAPTVL